MISNWYNEKFPRWAKILVQIFVGYLASPAYRIILFVDDCVAKKEKKNVFALIMGIVAMFPLADVVFWVVDIFTVAIKGTYTWLTGSKKE